MADRNESAAAGKTAIRVENLNKIYKLYERPKDRLLEALGLSRQKRYRELYALKDVSFDVRKGETVGIIGTNGSGKSTILKIITGVLTPTSGRVVTDGRISALLELGAGFNMEYTGIENIYLNGTMMGFSEAEIDERLDSILKFADIGDFINQPVKTYSSGMFVRLAFALSINIDPEILSVDEALSVGDVFFQAKCYHKFEEFRNAGKTILFVSHDLSSVAKYCDRVVLLNKGVKTAEGNPKEIVDLYKKLLVDYSSGAETEEEGNAEGTDAEPQTEDLARKQEESDSLTGILPMNPDMLEYGEHQAHFTKITTFDDAGCVTSSIEKGAYFTIEARIRFDADVEDPICAYTFKDLKGTEITGTNTLFEGREIGSMKAGDEVKVTFRQKMTLQGGEYLLSFGCTGYHEGEFRVFQRLYDVLNVTVISTKNTVGFYDMEAEVSIVRKKQG